MLLAYKANDPLAPNGSRATGPTTDTALDTTTRSAFPLLAEGSARRMSNPHRGLPPLTSLGSHSHSDRDARQPPPPPPPTGSSSTLSVNNAYQSQPLGQLPEAPRPGQSSDDAMRNWLSTKAEEERRRQEEERTKQEGLKLEQRKIEQSMLRDSIQAGIPPPMVPMVFAGMGGSEVAKASLEWAQHYMSQMSIAQPNGTHQAALPPGQAAGDARQDARTMPGPQANPYASQAPPSLPAPPPPPASHAAAQNQQPGNSFNSPYQQQTQNAARFPYQQQPQQQESASLAQQRQQPPQPQPPQQQQQQSSTLSRLITGGSLADMHIQQPPPGGMQMPTQPGPPHRPHAQGPTSTPQQQQQQQQQQQPHNSSPAIYFHHWTPPNTNKDSTSSGTKSTHTSPYAQNATSHLRHEYVNSPKKRRTGGSGGGSVGDRHSENGTAGTSPQDADSPRFEVLRPGDVAAGGSRKRGMSNVTRPDSDRQSSLPRDRQGSAGPGERKRTLSGTPKAEVDVRS